MNNSKKCKKVYTKSQNYAKILKLSWKIKSIKIFMKGHNKWWKSIKLDMKKCRNKSNNKKKKNWKNVHLSQIFQKHNQNHKRSEIRKNSTNNKNNGVKRNILQFKNKCKKKLKKTITHKLLDQI